MAKLSIEQLTGDLNKGLAPIYVVSGDEHLVVQECCDRIRQAAREQGFDERELYHADYNFDWNQLHHSGQSLSLFGSRKIIEVRLTGKLSDKGRKALVEYAGAPPADNLLLIVAPKFERNVQSAKWFKTVEGAGRFIPVWPVNPGQLPRWIRERAKRLEIQVSDEAVDILASRVEGNLLAAAQELEKLKLLADEGRVDAGTMAHAVADSARYDVYSLVDKALHGDARGAVKTLNGLKSEGTEVLAVLWALSRELRTLLQLSEAVAAGKPFQSVARQYGVWDKRQPLVKNALARLKPAQLNLLLRKAGQVDRATKGMHDSDPWEGCLEIVLNLSGVFPLTRPTETLALKS
ncbi:DNA polymerase III subunit delta [Gilvimarinus sp. F26214L]|uniref:DNA polymerase III subunit delta n=1 Tax=Gilvimarinus sp. DZF01 TaxID=3461371 RepID=UPI004045C0D2